MKWVTITAALSAISKDNTMQMPETKPNLQAELEDVKYFYEKFRKYQDVKSAQQLNLAIEAFLKAKGD